MNEFRVDTFLYPNTFFLNDHLVPTVDADLARAVWVANFLADDNPVAHEWFASVAAVEFYANDSTRQEEVDVALKLVMDKLLTDRVAMRALVRNSYASGFEPESESIDDKTEALIETMLAIRDSPSSGLVGLSPDVPGPSPEAVMEVRYAAMDAYDLGNAILYLDLLRLQAPSGSDADAGRRDSVFREAILRSETFTGVRSFDECFDTIRDQALEGGYSAGLTVVEKAWCERHAGDFYPEDYRAARAAATLDRTNGQDAETHVSGMWKRFAERGHDSQRWLVVQQTLDTASVEGS